MFDHIETETPPKAGRGSQLSRLNDAEYLELIEKAKQTQKLAYAPYSQYKVGAAILAKSGKVYIGANVENASYGATICAERTAIGSMILGGDSDISVIAVVTDDSGYPCGMCLQALNEFSSDPKSTQIVVPSKGGFQIHSLQELAPYIWRSEFVSKSK